MAKELCQQKGILVTPLSTSYITYLFKERREYYWNEDWALDRVRGELAEDCIDEAEFLPESTGNE